MNIKRLVAVLFLACLVLSVSPSMAGEPSGLADPLLIKLLRAVEADDYAGFVADANDAFRAGLTKGMLHAVSERLAPRMRNGYEVSYLGELKQQGCRVFLWKLVYKDGADDTLAKLVLQNGKVAGFWLQ